VTEERRRQARLALTMPVRVSGFAADGHPWTEMSTLKDATASGAAFSLKHAVTRGHVLHLSLPLPKRFRSYDLSEASYHVFALVRSANPEPTGCRVGVMFLGKNPPRGFDKEPAGLYLLPNDAPPAKSRERRQHTRLDVFVNVKLTRLDGMPGPHDERTIAENISRGGARVLSALVVTPGDVLLFGEVDGDFETRAEVCGVYVGPDRIPRLFRPFSQADSSTARLYGGTGLGLAISRRLVEGLGGGVAFKHPLSSSGDVRRFSAIVCGKPALYDGSGDGFHAAFANGFDTSVPHFRSANFRGSVAENQLVKAGRRVKREPHPCLATHGQATKINTIEVQLVEHG
jgi:hypothetical protein